MVELAAFMVVCWMGWKFVRAVWAHRHAVARKIKSAQNLLCDDSGQDMIEYALIAAVIAVAALWSFGNLSNNIGNLFNSVGNELAGGAVGL